MEPASALCLCRSRPAHTCRGACQVDEGAQQLPQLVVGVLQHEGKAPLCALPGRCTCTHHDSAGWDPDSARAEPLKGNSERKHRVMAIGLKV